MLTTLISVSIAIVKETGAGTIFPTNEASVLSTVAMTTGLPSHLGPAAALPASEAVICKRL